MSTKKCRSCNLVKEDSGFSKEQRNSDGLDSWCKKCRANKAREYRKKNKKKVNTRKREWRRSRQDIESKQQAERRRKSPDKFKARDVINGLIRSGKLKRQTSCSDCGCKCKPEAHHDDYSKPLEVRWLCKQCHTSKHSEVA